jgi:hypothetical protein
MSQPCVFCGHNVFDHNLDVLDRNSPPDPGIPCPECPRGLCFKERPPEPPCLEGDPEFQLAWACYRFPDADTPAERDLERTDALLQMRAIGRRYS